MAANYQYVLPGAQGVYTEPRVREGKVRIREGKAPAPHPHVGGKGLVLPVNYGGKPMQDFPPRKRMVNVLDEFGEQVYDEDGDKLQKEWKPARGTLARREIRKFQKSTIFLIKKKPFLELLKDVSQEIESDFRWRAEAVEAAHQAVEAYGAALFKGAEMLARFRGVQGVTPRDFRMLLALRGEEEAAAVVPNELHAHKSDAAPPPLYYGAGKGPIMGYGKLPSSKTRSDPLKGITKPAVKRMARRGGVERYSPLLVDATRDVLKIFLNNVCHDSLVYAESARRKTVMEDDVCRALKKQGRALYN